MSNLRQVEVHEFNESIYGTWVESDVDLDELEEELGENLDEFGDRDGCMLDEQTGEFLIDPRTGEPQRREDLPDGYGPYLPPGWFRGKGAKGKGEEGCWEEGRFFERQRRRGRGGLARARVAPLRRELQKTRSSGPRSMTRRMLLRPKTRSQKPTPTKAEEDGTAEAADTDIWAKNPSLRSRGGTTQPGGACSSLDRSRRRRR